MEWFLHDVSSSSVGFQITAPTWTWMISTHPPAMDLWTLSSPVKLALCCDLPHQVVLRMKSEKYVMRVCPLLGTQPASSHQLQFSHESSLLPPALMLTDTEIGEPWLSCWKRGPEGVRGSLMATFHPYPLLLLYGQASFDDTTAAPSQKLLEKRPRLLCVTLIFALLETPASLNVKINSLGRHLKETQIFWPFKEPRNLNNKCQRPGLY